ncbi:acyl-CoA dehydrogenase [Acidocella aquatica]|uniref:Acyl-CoA dehydrogenase n=1 Tax=Acidocella aquatica TaxID=1922313 RepID=A0ABQ6A5N0_9PROT|nr:acyl-CoA dehydrogenase family protein [Acidocella aquatica]GLR66968.1 acyl-CoA dehydrogenase [Acidocella aquatica]
MDFSLTGDHLALRDAVRKFCDGEYPLHQCGNAEAATLSASRWAALAELGLFGLDISAAYDGSGLTAVEIMLAAQELGRRLGGGSWIASNLPAAYILSKAGRDAQRSTWLPKIAVGRRRLSLAYLESGWRYDLAKPAVTAVQQNRGWLLNGTKINVPGADAADGFVVSAGDDALFIVDARTPGVSVQSFRTLDGRAAGHVTLDGATVSGEALITGAGRAVLQAAIDYATAALCAEATGAIEALIDLTTDYLKTREQFGQPLVKFQVLQHGIADALIDLEQSKSMACVAALAAGSEDAGQRARLISAAKVTIGNAARRVGQWAIQMHGAMGMTDECRAGHYAKRLLVINQMFGDASYHLQRFIKHMAQGNGNES